MLSWAPYVARASLCLTSSRLKTRTALGRWVLRIRSRNAFPNEPVPPVRRIVESSQVSGGRVVMSGDRSRSIGARSANHATTGLLGYPSRAVCYRQRPRARAIVRLFSPRMSHIRQPAAPPSLEIEPGLPPRISSGRESVAAVRILGGRARELFDWVDERTVELPALRRAVATVRTALRIVSTPFASEHEPS